MKKIICLFLSLILLITFQAAASAAGYTLLEKLQKQLVVGSGLKGSFVIHCNADQEKYPFLHAIQNAEIEIRGIESDNNLHYYFYQPGENDSRNHLTEFERINDRCYIKSDLLGPDAYCLPDLNQIISNRLNIQGETPPVLSDLIKIFLADDTENSSWPNAELYERQVEMWLSAFSSETAVQKSDDATPKLTQVYTIPLESLYSFASDFIRILTSNEAAMSFLLSHLNDDQIATYLNPDLGYYYLDAMKSLDLKGDILFSRTVSTMGDLIQNSMTLPLDASRTGYETLFLQSNEKTKSYILTGSKGTLFLELPIHFDLKAESFEEQTIRFARLLPDQEGKDSYALRMTVRKSHQKYDDEAETKNHEEDQYHIHIENDPEDLPELISGQDVSAPDPADISINIHYSSKLQLSSPTTMEISCSINQGAYHFLLNGNVKTASPWTFSPFETADAVQTAEYTTEDFERLFRQWAEEAEKKLTRIPEEIKELETPASSIDTAQP